MNCCCHIIKRKPKIVGFCSAFMAGFHSKIKTIYDDI